MNKILLLSGSNFGEAYKFLNSTLYFQSAAVMGGRNTNSQPA